MEVIKGIPVSPGVVIGPALLLEDVVNHVPYHTVAQGLRAQELERFDHALRQTLKDIEADRAVQRRSWARNLPRSSNFILVWHKMEL